MTAGTAKKSRRWGGQNIGGQGLAVPWDTRDEAPNDYVNDDDVNGHEREFGAGRNADPQDRPPNFQLRFPLRNAEAQIAEALLEIQNGQDIRDENGDKCRERRAGHAHPWERSYAEDEEGREDDVENYAQHLKSDRGLDDASRAQGRA